MSRLAACVALGLVAASPALAVDPSAVRFESSAGTLAVLGLQGVGRDQVAQLRATKGATHFCELGDTLVLTSGPGVELQLPFPVASRRDVAVRGGLSEPLLAEHRGRTSPLDEFRDRLVVLFEEGPFCVFQATPGLVKRVAEREGNHFRVMTFGQDLRLRVPASRALEGAPATRPASMAPDLERLMADVKALQDCGTRYTYSQGYKRAVEFCKARFEALGYETRVHEFESYGGRKGYNVVAQTSLTTTPPSFYIVEGHLDCTSPQAQSNAPGADDNGTGSAGVLEIARLLAGTPGAPNVRFLLVGGEEQGMVGSGAYVKSLKQSGELAKVLGAVNFDMLGYDGTPPVSALIETREFSEPFYRSFAEAAPAAGVAELSFSFQPWGSDHMPFLNNQVPCFLFIEKEYDDNPGYHQVTDTVDLINQDLFKGIVGATATALNALVNPEASR